MANASTLAKARRAAVKRAQAVSKLQESLQLSSPLSTSSHSHLDFRDSESDTSMAPPSDAEADDTAPTARNTRSRKRGKPEESESDETPVKKNQEETRAQAETYHRYS